MPRSIHVSTVEEFNKHLNAKGFGGNAASVREIENSRVPLHVDLLTAILGCCGLYRVLVRPMVRS